jgi:hypothetical protein
MMVEGDHLERAGRSSGEGLRDAVELGRPQGTALLLPGSDRVEPADDQALGAVRRLRLGPGAQELVEGARHAPGRPPGDVVVARNDEQGPVQRTEQRGGPFVLGGLVPVCEVAARDDKLRVESADQRPQIVLHFGLLSRARMEIGHLQDA